jgi:TRAP-type C4-dicarboxylate transport system substrate-binding protein
VSRTASKFALALLIAAASVLPAAAQDKIRIAGNFATEHSSSIAMEQVFKAELGWMELGSRHVTNKVRSIESAADLKGLKT